MFTENYFLFLRYNSREESGSEATLFDGKIERIKYTDTPDCPTRKRNKLRNSISDQESHHSQSPPRSRHESRSTSPVSKERKSLKDRLHHRIKSPSSHNSSLVNSPCRDTLLDDLETNSEYRDSRSKSSDAKIDDIMTDLSYTSPRSSSEKEGSEKMLSKSECDSFRSRSSLDAESADEAGINSDQLGQLERKKRLLASSNVKSAKDTSVTNLKTGSDKPKPKNSASHNSLKSSKVNCLSEATVEELKSELESVNVQYECAKEKSQNDCANAEMKYLKKKQVQILHLLDQLHEGVNSSDDCSVDGERVSRKKHRSSSTCLETNSICENDILKSHTKDECGSKLCKSGVKDPALLAKLKKTDSVDGNNCIALSLDSFIFRKHLDPRKGFDQHSVSLATVNSLQKCRRISVDNDSCLPNTHGTSDSFLCVPSSIATDVSWKKQCSSLSDVNFSENENDSAVAISHFKIKEENLDEEILNKKSHLSNSHPLDIPKTLLAIRAISDGLSCHEIKRERDISPLSLPLPKFAASLRSPKSSPSILTSPKSSSAHSPRAGHSPSSYASGKSIRIPDLLHDIPSEKKSKDIVPDEKINGANISPVDSVSMFESQTNNDTLESMPSVEPIQSPKSNCDKIKECISSSESEFSPSSSPNRPSIEDRIKALDEKFNAWSGSTRTASTTITDITPSSVPDLTTKCSIKRSRFSYLTETRKEPSEIVKSLLARSTIFDQDSKRLQHIDEKYEPLNIKMDLSPKVKPTFRTKAAAKEFSTPITPALQNFSQSLLGKSPSVIVAQGIMSPPATPQSASSSILSPVTPSVPQYTQLPPSVFTPCSPRSSSFSLPSTLLKGTDTLNSPLDKDINEQILKSPQVFNSVKVKVDPSFQANSAVLATSLKSSPLTCPSETPSHGSVVTSLSIKKEPNSPTEAVTENVCKVEIDSKISVKKDVINSTNIPVKKESNILSATKEHSHFNSLDQEKKEFCDPKDPRLSLSEEVGQWRESGCKDETRVSTDSCAKPYSCSDVSENSSVPASKKRVSSIDSNESDSCKSLNPGDISMKLSLESSRDSHESNWVKQDKSSEPEPKKPKLSKSARERSLSPPLHQLSKKSDKKEKTLKGEKNKSAAKSTTGTNPEKVRHEIKCNNKSDYKDKPKSDHKSSKDEKRSKSKDSKDSASKNETQNKPQERRNSEKDNKSSASNNSSSNKPKKDSSNKNEKSNEKKQSEKKSTKSKSNKFDFSAFMDDEPVYFSMYDKVKARSSKSQTLKHQTTSDLESVRQKFSKLKQSRAKREEKSKSIEQDSDKDSDSSHHSTESDSEAKPVKVKQQRKRKLVIESSSEEDTPAQDMNSHSAKTEKDFQSDSATDSDFDYNVSHRQTSNKSRRKKTDLLDSDSSDSDSNFHSKSQQSGRKKSTSNRSKGRVEKSKKIIKSEDDMSDAELHKNQKNKEKEKSKKVKKDKEAKSEHEPMECDPPKKAADDSKTVKKKLSKEVKSETDLSPVQKKFKPDHTKEKVVAVKEKKVESCSEKVQSSEETEKHKPYAKKRKKSKKMSRNKDKRTSDKNSQDISRKQLEESDTKSSLPILLSPKPSSPLPDKQLSPPCLQAGILSDNDFKSDFSDFDFENQQTEEMDASRDMWKHLDAKSDTNSEKSSKNKKKDTVSKSESVVMHSPEQDSSLPSFFDKLSDITDSETGREGTDFIHDMSTETSKQVSFSVRKEKDFSTSPLKSKHEKHEDQSSSKQDSVKYSDSYNSPTKEERRRKKSKKQCKERKKKAKEEMHSKEEIVDSASVSSPKPLLFEPIGGDEDSRLSDSRLDEDIAEEARRLEQELLVASEETSTFGDDGPAKREEKLLERRFEEEAAKETRRLEAELLSTGRDSWHMKEKEYDSEANSRDLCDDKHTADIDPISGKEENIFAGLELHSSVAESSQNETDVFLSGHPESDPYKIDDKDVANEMEDQRKIEDDLAVSALLQEMQCGEISAPELTKEADYLDMEAHPDDTMNYLLPDDGENSLHIADSSPDAQGNDSQEAKLESSDVVLSPSSNSEPPPALEISNVEDSIIMKLDSENQISENMKNESTSENPVHDHKTSCYEFSEENSLEMCESKPPVIDLPAIQNNMEQIDTPLSPKSELSSILKKRQNDKSFRLPPKPDVLNNNDDTDDECSSDLTENQLTHFEDITNDTADSKDDDNPPILLPVESPPNLLPVSDSKEQMEPLDKVAMDDNQCLDRIIGKVPSGDSIFDKVTDLDKQIGDIISSITELKKHTLDNDGFRVSGAPEVSELSDHNISDPLGLSNNANMFDPPNPEQPAVSQEFDSDEIQKSSEKEASSSEQPSLSLNYNDESSNNKFENPQSSSSCVLETPMLSYSDIISSNCETTVIHSTQKMDNDAVTISITEKNSLPSVQQFEENRDMNNVSDGNQASSDSFLLELFGPKNEENFKIETDLSREKEKTESEFDSHSETKKVLEPELSTLDFGLQHEIKPLFEIPEVNEQNEATEFNQEIFERPSDVSKESIPRLLSFSSEHFPESSVKKVDDVAESNEAVDSAALEKEEEKLGDKEPKSETDDHEIDTSTELDSKKEPEVLPELDEKKPEELKEENLNIEESLENKVRPADAESVCSDTTDITIPETKVEIENNQVISSEEQIQEDVCPVEEVEINVKPKTERPRRGRRPKTRRYVETIQKQESPPENQNPPVNMRITRRGGGRPTSSERTRRSLRSDTSELHRDLNENKQSVAEEIVLSEVEDAKKEEEVMDVSANETLEAENSITSNSSHVETEVKLPEKPLSVKSEEPKRRRGRRKKNSGDHGTQSVDKLESKSEEHEHSKDFNRSKDSRLLLSLSDREQKSSKESSANLIDIYAFTEEEQSEHVKFESMKKRLHENTRTNVSVTDSKHDNKGFDSISEKKEKSTEESKSKTTPNEDRESSSKEQHHTEGNQHRKLSMTIRLQKDGRDGTAEVIKTSEALNIEESKPEPSKPERNTSTKHDNTADTSYNGPCKSTRKSMRLMNQALSSASRSTVDEVIEDVVKGNFKSSGSNSSSHPEPVPTRVTRRSRSSRHSEESLPMQLDVSEDTSEDKNKNEPVFFIPDNAVKEVLPESKKNTSSHTVEATPVSDVSSVSESDKNNDRIATLRNFRMKTRSAANKLECNKDASHTLSANAGEHDFHKKDAISNSSAEDKFDALQKEHKEVKETVKETKSTIQDNNPVIHSPLPELKVELARMIFPTVKEICTKPDKITDNEEDSDSRSSPAVLIDPVTGFLTPVTKTTESNPEGLVTTSSAEIKSSSSLLVSDVSSITSLKTVKVSSSETQSITSAHDNSKNNQSKETSVVGRAPLVQSLRSRQLQSAQIAVTVQSSMSSPSVSDSTPKQSVSEKTVEHVKKPAKKTASSAVPVLTIANSVVSSAPVTSSCSESVSVTSSLSVSTTHSQSPVITNLGVPITATVTQSSSLPQEKDDIQTSSLPKISHSAVGYQPPVRAIVTAVVTQMSAGHSASLSSNVQTKCSNSVSTSSSVLITPEVNPKLYLLNFYSAFVFLYLLL